MNKAFFAIPLTLVAFSSFALSSSVTSLDSASKSTQIVSGVTDKGKNCSITVIEPISSRPDMINNKQVTSLVGKVKVSFSKLEFPVYQAIQVYNGQQVLSEDLFGYYGDEHQGEEIRIVYNTRDGFLEYFYTNNRKGFGIFPVSEHCKLNVK